jgi:hypothetical protein
MAGKAKQVSGSCKWVKRMVLPRGLGRLSITSHTTRGPVVQEYDVGAHLDQAGRVTGYRLVKDDDEGYDVSAADWTCTCADSTYRQRECKHARAMRAALARLAG